MSVEGGIPRIALLQFGPHRLFAPLPTFDPHCLVAQTYMKFAGVAYVEDNCNNPNASPINKLPVLAINESKTVVHTDIFQELASMGYNLDSKLSDGEKADVEAWSSLVQHRLHHAQLYNWWAESSNYDEVTHLVFSRALPFPLNFLLPSRHKKNILTQLAAAGFTDERVAYEEAAKCYKALSVKLGSKKYLYGEHPTSLDAVVFAFLATQLIPELPQRKLHYLISQHHNLVDYVNNILSNYFNAQKPIGIDVEPAQRWLKAIEDERASQEAAALETPTTKDSGTSWSIAFGIGATVLFLATQNLQFYVLWTSISQRFFKKDEDTRHVGGTKKYTKEQEEERAKWFGPGGDYSMEETHAEPIRRGPNIVHDPDENPMKSVHRFAPDDDAEVYIGDDGNAYDWDEKYLEEMETGSDIPEDYEDLGEDEEDDYE